MKRVKSPGVKEVSVGRALALVLPGSTNQSELLCGQNKLFLADLLHEILLKEILPLPLYPNGCFCYPVLFQTVSHGRESKKKTTKIYHSLLYCFLVPLFG